MFKIDATKKMIHKQNTAITHNTQFKIYKKSLNYRLKNTGI